MEEQTLTLKFDKTIFRVMKQRKNAYMKREILEELDWSEFVKLCVVCNGSLL